MTVSLALGAVRSAKVIDVDPMARYEKIGVDEELHEGVGGPKRKGCRK
jgi:hypothetical protein